MAFPPLVSSTPPPLDDVGAESDEDEFGDFTTGTIDGLSIASDSPYKVEPGSLSNVVSPKVNGEITNQVLLNAEQSSKTTISMLKDEQVLIVEQCEDKDNAIKMVDEYEFVVSKDELSCNNELEDKEIDNYTSNKDEPSFLSSENCEPALTMFSVQDSSSPELTTTHLDEQDEFNNESILTDNCPQQETDSYKIEQTESNIIQDTRFDMSFDSISNDQVCSDNFTFDDDTTNQCQQNVCLKTDNEFDSNQYDVNLSNDDNVQLVETFGSDQVNDSANDDEDDFGDFADFSNAPNMSSPCVKFATVRESEPTCLQSLEDDDNDVDNEDFGDVQSFNYTNAGQIDETLVAEKKLPELSESNKSFQVDDKVSDIITELFPNVSTEIEVNLEPLIKMNDCVWNNMKSIEETIALNYQWNNSTSNNLFLSALGIDSRNILFGPKWNSAVPRFAANLGFSPLEPVKALSSQSSSNTTASKSSNNNSNNAEDVPAAQFDWNSSGLVNPLDSSGGLSALLPLDLLYPFDPLLTPHCNVHSEPYHRHAVCIRNLVYCPDVASPEASLSHERRKELMQVSKLIEPLPGPSTQNWNQGCLTESSSRSLTKDNTKKVLHASAKTSVQQQQDNCDEQVFMDRFGRLMSISPQSAEVLKQLPDLSFLSARTLMFNPEHRQIVNDLGAMINRKMPG